MSEDEKLFHPLKFRLIRIKAGYGRAELASEAKISKDSIKLWEKGRFPIRPGMRSLRRCAKVLGCDVDDFMEPVSWVPDEDDLILLNLHFQSARAGQHRIGGSTNPKTVRFAAPVSEYVEQWLKRSQSAP